MIINPIFEKIEKEENDNKIIKTVFFVNKNEIEKTEGLDYVGYLEIPKFNLKRIIKVGNTKDILDSNYVLYYNSFKSLDKNNNNIILLGHNIESVFRFLHYMDVGDSITLVTYTTCYNFQITNIDIIPETEVDVLNKSYNEKTLTLITCMKNNKNRLVVTAEIKKII